MPVIPIPEVYLKMGDRTHEATFREDLWPNRITFPPATVKSYTVLVYWPKEHTWLDVKLSTISDNKVDPWYNGADPQFDAQALAKAGMFRNTLTESNPEFFRKFQVWGTHLAQGGAIRFGITLKTDKKNLSEFVKTETARQAASGNPATSVSVPLFVEAFHGTGGRTISDRKEVHLQIGPLTRLRPFAGHVAIDFGNFSSSVAVLGRAPNEIRTLCFGNIDAPQLIDNGETMDSVVTINKIHSWFPASATPHPFQPRTFPDTDRFVHDDSSEAVDWITGHVAANGDLKGQIGGAKRLLTGTDIDQTRTVMIPHRRNNFPMSGSPVNTVEEAVEIRDRLPGELILTRMVQSLMKATDPHLISRTPAGWPDSIAITYPTSYSPREIEQLRTTVHRAWLRSMSCLQRPDTAAPTAARPPAPGQSVATATAVSPVEKQADKIANELIKRLGRLKNRQQAMVREAQDPLVHLLIDEATAAGFYYLFRFSAQAPGGLDSFRYKFPDGMNVLLYDCGGGTTDISLVQGKVDPANSKRLITSVLGRSGVRSFGGDDITAAVCRIFKAKLARLVGEVADQDARPPQPLPRPVGETGGELLADGARIMKKFLDETRYSVNGQEIVPTTFVAGNFGQETDAPRANMMRLWRIGEKLKRLFAGTTDPFAVVKLDMLRGESFLANIHPLHAAVLNLVPLGEREDLVERIRQMPIQRWEVDSLIAAQVIRSLACCRYLYEPSDDPHEPRQSRVVHKVVVTGNAARYPMIPEMIINELGVCDLPKEDWFQLEDDNLKNAVAKGAVQALEAVRSAPINSFQFPTDLSERLPYTVAYRDWTKREFIPICHLQELYSKLTDPKPIPIEASQDASTPDGQPATGQTITLFRRFPGDGADLPDEYQDMPAFDAEDEVKMIRDYAGFTPFQVFQFPTGITSKDKMLKVRYSIEEHQFVVEDDMGRGQSPADGMAAHIRTLPPYQRGNI